MNPHPLPTALAPAPVAPQAPVPNHNTLGEIDAQVAGAITLGSRPGKSDPLSQAGDMHCPAGDVLAAPILKALVREVSPLAPLQRMLAFDQGLRALAASTGPLKVEVPLHMLVPALSDYLVKQANWPGAHTQALATDRTLARFMLTAPGGMATTRELVLDGLFAADYADGAAETSAVMEAIRYLEDRCADTALADRIPVTLKLSLLFAHPSRDQVSPQRLTSGIASYGRVQDLTLMCVRKDLVAGLMHALKNNPVTDLTLTVADATEAADICRLLGQGLQALPALRSVKLVYHMPQAEHEVLIAGFNAVNQQIHQRDPKAPGVQLHRYD